MYSLLRVGIFAAILALLLTLRVEPWLAAVVAAVFGLCVSYIFFRPQRDALALSVQRFRQGERRDADSDAENDALDSREQSGDVERPSDSAAPLTRAPIAAEPRAPIAAEPGDPDAVSR